MTPWVLSENINLSLARFYMDKCYDLLLKGSLMGILATTGFKVTAHSHRGSNVKKSWNHVEATGSYWQINLFNPALLSCDVF